MQHGAQPSTVGSNAAALVGPSSAAPGPRSHLLALACACPRAPAPDEALAKGKGRQRVAIKFRVGHAIAHQVAAQAQARRLPSVVAVQHGLRVLGGGRGQWRLAGLRRSLPALEGACKAQAGREQAACPGAHWQAAVPCAKQTAAADLRDQRHVHPRKALAGDEKIVLLQAAAAGCRRRQRCPNNKDWGRAAPALVHCAALPPAGTHISHPTSKHIPSPPGTRRTW